MSIMTIFLDLHQLQSANPRGTAEVGCKSKRSKKQMLKQQTKKQSKSSQKHRASFKGFNKGIMLPLRKNSLNKAFYNFLVASSEKI